MAPPSDPDRPPARVARDPLLSQVAVFGGVSGYSEESQVHGLVEQALEALRLPETFIQPGDKVVLKPNWVKEHDERKPGPGQWEHVVTHPTIIDATARWVAKQLKGRGEVVICDAPQTDSSFKRLQEYCGLHALRERCERDFPGVRFDLVDLRPVEWQAIDGITIAETRLPGDPRGQTQVNLNEASEFVDYPGLGRLYGASYDMAETNWRHRDREHQYLLCRTAMEADVLINLPKLKTHKKVGITCALKNLVGINANKNWLPHHTEGTPDQGGDQFPDGGLKHKLESAWMGTAKRWLKNRRALSRLFIPLKKTGRYIFGDTQRVIRSGNWHGNDTCWRMVLDLNKCLFFFDGRGQPRRQPLRYLAVVDGIIAGEGNGPMSPDPKRCGIVLAGRAPLAVDCVAATLMGFDWAKLRLLERAFKIDQLNFSDFRPEEIQVISNQGAWNKPMLDIDGNDVFHFRPHFGWVGAIENRDLAARINPEQPAGIH